MLSSDAFKKLTTQSRHVEVAKTGDDDLGPLRLLPGVWKNTGNFQGRGWNMIALPFAGKGPGYRLLMNQYEEELHFSIADKAVKNRGVRFGGQSGQTDQTVVALEYDQSVTQISAADSPNSGRAIAFGSCCYQVTENAA